MSLTSLPPLAVLDYYSIIQISGSDARAFLQNQFSNDISQLAENRSQLSSYSSAKGMMYANFRVVQHADGYWLRLSRDIASSVCQRLRLFVLRDDVQLEVVAQPVVLGVCGSEAERTLAQLKLAIPAATDEVACTDGIRVVKCLSAEGESRYELFSSDMSSLQAAPLAETATDYLRSQLRSGEAFISQATYEQFVAQNLNLELINGVSFKKGCYPGQEYIARTQYRGQVRSRTYLIQADTPLHAGQAITNPEHPDGDTIGTVINACDTLALAVIRNKHVEQGNIGLPGTGDNRIHALSLPYPLKPAR